MKPTERNAQRREMEARRIRSTLDAGFSASETAAMLGVPVEEVERMALDDDGPWFLTPSQDTGPPLEWSPQHELTERDGRCYIRYKVELTPESVERLLSGAVPEPEEEDL